MAKKKKLSRESSKKKAIYKCVECGREISVDECGISLSTLVCCGRQMKRK